jgi:hypothetical protein
MLLRSRLLDQRVQICSEGVVVIPDGRLTRAAEAAPVVADHSVAGCEQVPLLAFPRVAVQRVAMDQHDRLSAAVVLVVDVDRGVVLGGDGERRHGCAPFLGSRVARVRRGGCAAAAAAPATAAVGATWLIR